MSPTKAGPRVAPMRRGIRRAPSATSRSARSILPSSSPDVVGAPAVRITLPPSRSMSVPRKATPWAVAARCTSETNASSSAAARPAPTRAISSSVPPNLMKATVTERCSGSPRAPSRCWRSDSGTPPVRSTSRRGRGPDSSRFGPSAGARRKRHPAPRGAPRTPGRSARAVPGLTTISPAAAADSISTVAVAPGPVTTSSRWPAPTRKKSNAPLCTPTDIRSVAVVPRSGVLPSSRSAPRIPIAARAARCSWPRNEKNSKSASPPNFRRDPPFS